MIILIIIAALVSVFLIIFDEWVHQQIKEHLWMRVLKYSVLVLIAAFTVFSLIFTIGEVAAGDMSGFSHLIPLIPLAIISYLLLKRSKINTDA